MIRAIVFRLHLSVAAASGAVVFVMAATGVILSLKETVLELAERRYFVAAPENAPRMAPEFLAGAVEFTATSLRYRPDPRAPVRVEAGRDRFAYVDPYTGEVLGSGPGGPDRFFEDVLGWHRWLNVSDGSVRRARAVTGVANVAFCFLLLTGPLLWIPRPMTRRSLADVLFFRRDARSAGRDLNLHQVVGIWSVLPLSVIAATGVVTSYPWVGDRIYPAVGRIVPVEAWSDSQWMHPREHRNATGEGARDTGARDSPPPHDLEAVLAVAAERTRGWRTLILTLPRQGDTDVRVEVRRGRSGQPHKTGILTVDAATGAVRESASFVNDTPARRAQQFLRHAHTGEYWGPGGRLLAGLFSLAATLMTWTGMSLAVRRLRRFVQAARKRRK